MRDSNPRPLLYESSGGRGVLFAAVVAAALAEPAEADSSDDCPPRELELAAPVEPQPQGRPGARAQEPARDDVQGAAVARLTVRARQGSALWWALMEAPREDGEGVERG